MAKKRSYLITEITLVYNPTNRSFGDAIYVDTLSITKTTITYQKMQVICNDVNDKNLTCYLVLDDRESKWVYKSKSLRFENAFTTLSIEIERLDENLYKDDKDQFAGLYLTYKDKTIRSIEGTRVIDDLKECSLPKFFREFVLSFDGSINSIFNPILK